MYILILIIGILIVSVLINKFIWHAKITITEMLINLCVIIVVLLVFWLTSYFNKIKDTEVLNSQVLSKQRQTSACLHSYPCRCHTVCSGRGRSRVCSPRCSVCFLHPFDFNYQVKTNLKDFVISNLDPQGLIEPPTFKNIKIGDGVAALSSFDNYIKASSTSILSQQLSLSKEELASIPSYPSQIYDYYKLDRVIDKDKILSPQELKTANDYLTLTLGSVGFAKQANAIILLTRNNEEYALKLINHWYGGKKNDVIVIIGLDDTKQINYVRIHSWSLHNIFDVVLRDDIKKLKTLNITAVIDAIKDNLSKQYVRRSFKEFEYLKWRVMPSQLSIVAFTIICLGLSFALGYWLSREHVNISLRNFFTNNR